MEHILTLAADTITSLVEATGYPAIFVLMLLESMFIPIPSEVTMPFAGFLASVGKLDFWLVVVIGGVANLVGSLIGYQIGKWGQKHVIYSWVRKYGKFLLITVDELERSEKWFRTHGEIITFLSRLLPVVRTFISLPAGMSQMNVKKFAVYTLAGTLIWSALLTYLGFTLGKNWHSIEQYFRQFQYLIIGAFVLLGVWYVYHKVSKIRKQ